LRRGPEENGRSAEVRSGRRLGKLHNLYSSPCIIRMMKARRMTCRSCSKTGKKRNLYRILVDKPEEKRSLGRL
jgi:hypothetical protein